MAMIILLREEFFYELSLKRTVSLQQYKIIWWLEGVVGVQKARGMWSRCAYVGEYSLPQAVFFQVLKNHEVLILIQRCFLRKA